MVCHHNLVCHYMLTLYICIPLSAVFYVHIDLSTLLSCDAFNVSIDFILIQTRCLKRILSSRVKVRSGHIQNNYVELSRWKLGFEPRLKRQLYQCYLPSAHYSYRLGNQRPAYLIPCLYNLRSYSLT